MSAGSEIRGSNHRTRLVALTVFAALLVLAGTSGRVWALYTGEAGSSGNELAAAADWVAPTASSAPIGKSQGGVSGYIRKGGAYNVYADVTDSGAPASGVASVSAGVSAITTAQSAAALPFGAFTLGGESYEYRSAALTANATLAAGTYSYSLTSKDAAGYSRVQSGYTVIVDNTVPTATDVQTTNKSGNLSVGWAEKGDTVIFTFSEPIDPNSVLAGWTGAATDVVVRIDNNTPTNDRLSVYNAANSAQLPLGTVNLGRTDYAVVNSTFGASGTVSTMTQSGNAITLTLGTPSIGPTVASATGTMIWSPAAGAYDRAGNAESTATRSETGSADKEF